MNKNLNEMMLDLKKQSSIYRFGDYWFNYSEGIKKNINKYGLNNFRSNIRISDGFADVLNYDPFYNKDGRGIKFLVKNYFMKHLINNFFLKKYVLSAYSKLINEFADAYIASESKYINLKFFNEIEFFFTKFPSFETTKYNPSDYFLFKGKKIGKSYLNSILAYPFLLKTNISKSNVMLEIGGGFGANLHMILTAFPNIKKVYYVDIPPILHIGTEYLRAIYGDAVIDYVNSKKLDSLDFKKNNDIEIFCIAPWQLDKITNKVDLFVNKNSFQEMNINSIKNYINIIKSLKSDNFSAYLEFYDFSGIDNTVDPSNILDMFIKNNNGISLVSKEIYDGITGHFLSYAK